MIKKNGFLLLDTAIGLGLGCVILIISLIYVSGSYKVFMDFISSTKEQSEVMLLDQTIRHDIMFGNEYFEIGDDYFILGKVRYVFSDGKITRIVGTQQRSFEENKYSFKTYILNGKQFIEITETNDKNPQNKTTLMYNVKFIATPQGKSESD